MIRLLRAIDFPQKMSREVVGDLSELRLQTVTVPATHTGSGSSVSGHFRLSDCAELADYIDSHATVNIVGPLKFEVLGPVSSTVATSAVVALYPDKYRNGPSAKGHVLSLEGRVHVQHSLLVGSVTASPGQAREVGESLKIRTLVDYQPMIAFHVDIAGGTSSSSWTITVHTNISVGGVSHRKTW